MGVTWTEEQQKVIDLRNRNILVSAAAGSGKTAVLVERIITMLTADVNPIDVDQLLIVTFTEAAAAEMKERIRNAIEKKLDEFPENEHLKQQATLIHNAHITTIHSFCLSVIRDHFHVINLDPGFRIGEEGELKLLRQDVVKEILEACERNVVCTVTGDGIYPENRIDFKPYMELYQCSLDTVTGMINHAFAEITYRIFKEEPTFKGLYTSGGDVTVAVCQRFKTAGLCLLDEVLPLAAYGQFLKGEFEGVHIITKGGSQGGRNAINQCITYLKEKLYI